MEKAAKIISVLIHPIIMPSLGFLLLFNSGTYLGYLPFDYKKMILIIVILCTFVIPLSMIPFFLYQKMIFDIHLSRSRERYIPLVICFTFFLFCYFLLKRTPVPPDYQAFCLGCASSVLIVLLVISKWKISLHMVGIGGLAGLIIYLIIHMQVNLEFYLILTFLAAGLLGTARLILAAHKPFEIYTGFLVGCIVVTSAMFII
jgi:hypothetical protein